MSENHSQGDDAPSLPDDITARAGLPRQGEAVSSTEGIAGRTPYSAPGHAHETTVERVEEAAEIAAREAANGTSNLRDRLEETADRFRGHASDAYDDVRSWAADHVDEQGRRAGRLADRGFVRLREGRTATEAFVADNPLLVGVVGLAAGLLLGALLPRTRREDDALGPWADEVRDQGMRYAREMTHRGREYVEAALDTDNLDAAVRRASETHDDGYSGAERTAHRL